MIIVWALAVLFASNSLLITLRANFTVGTLLMWCITAVLIVYGLFHTSIDAFLAYGFGRVFKYVLLAGALVFAGLFMFVAISGYTDSAKNDEKAIIVLGAGLRGETVGDVLRRRLVAAQEAWEKNPTALIVVTGGQGADEKIPEALAMQRWLVANGVPEECIILEDKSTSTEQNLQFAQQLLIEAGIGPDEPVAVVTNAFHCYRASQYAEKVGFSDVRTVPASMNVTALLPSYMREVLAILFMWVFRRQID